MPFSVDVRTGRLLKDGTPVKFVPSPNISGARMEPNGLVYHDTAGSNAAGAVSWFANRASRVSAHLVVDIDGTVIQCVLLDRVAWHTGTKRNGDTIGIEIANVGELDLKGYSRATKKTYDDAIECTVDSHGGKRKWRPYTDAQMDAVEALTLAICAAYPIRELLGHWQLCPGRKVDPTPLFAWARMRECVKLNVRIPPAAAGLDVAGAQKALNALHYGAGAADGIVGPRTRSAIRAFQEQNHLPITGTLDKATSDLLMKKPGASAVALLAGPAVDEGPKPFPLGSRAELTPADLRARGSGTMTTLATVRWAQFPVLGLQMGDALGGLGQVLDGVDTSVAMLQRVDQLIPVIEKLAAWAVTPAGFKAIGAILLMCAIWKGTKIVEARRLADAQTGANVRV